MDATTIIVGTAVTGVVGMLAFFLRGEHSKLSKVVSDHIDLSRRHEVLAAELRPTVHSFEESKRDLQRSAREDRDNLARVMESIRDDLHEIDKKLAVAISRLNRLEHGNGASDGV